jgi:hypothetical protein
MVDRSRRFTSTVSPRNSSVQREALCLSAFQAPRSLLLASQSLQHSPQRRYLRVWLRSVERQVCWCGSGVT